MPTVLRVLAGSGIFLAIGIYAIAASAISFARREDARSVMRLGASLAMIQILDPMGFLIFAASLPGLFILGRRGMKLSHSAGFYALVLFMPVVAAIALSYFAHFQRLYIPQLIAGSLHAAEASSLVGLLADIAPLAIVTPVLLYSVITQRCWILPNLIVALLAGALCLAAVAVTLSGHARSNHVLIVGSAPLLLITIAHWPKSATRARDIALVAGVTLVLAWGLA